MAFNPKIHHRRSIRLPDYDYAAGGAYFVTVCTHGRECLFGDVVDGGMQLNEMGRTVRECWDDLTEHFPNVTLDVAVIMPNHFHGILVLDNGEISVGARHASPDSAPALDHGFEVSKRATHASPLRKAGLKSRSIGAIIGSFKSAVTKRINQTRQTPGVPVWQRNYYERVVRDERELYEVRQYIAHNPAKWAEDENHPKQFRNPSE